MAIRKPKQVHTGAQHNTNETIYRAAVIQYIEQCKEQHCTNQTIRQTHVNTHIFKTPLKTDQYTLIEQSYVTV